MNSKKVVSLYGHKQKIYKSVPIYRKMVYHETREVNGKMQNYLIENKRNKDKWIKKSKYIGSGKMPKKEIEEQKSIFIKEIQLNKKYKYLKEEEVKTIERLKESFNKNLKSLEKEEREQLEKSFFTELTYNTNAIEGSSLSLEETSLLLNEKIVPEGKTMREIYEARNHKLALEYVKNYKGDFNEAFILKLHSLILKDISSRFAGNYRKTRVKIFGSDVKFPDSEKVPQLIKNLIYFYKENKNTLHPFELATIISMKFVTIHPFIDGNGRVSRLIMNFLLTKKNYPWINIYNKNRAKYLKSTRKANDEDYSTIIPFLIKTITENLEDYNLSTKNT
jgi:Fic family protein